MDLKVLINQCSLAETGNFFVVVQIDELLYEERKKKTQKFRTELQLNTSNPHFRKNVFLFENLSFGSKLTFKLGCFSCRLLSEPSDIKILFVQYIFYLFLGSFSPKRLLLADFDSQITRAAENRRNIAK